MHTFTVASSHKNQLIDITQQVKEIVSKSKLNEGTCTIYTPHATAAILINENYDPHVMDDVIEALHKMVPEGKWKHDAVDNNGAAHIKAALIGPSEAIPFKEGKLMLGQWQDIMYAEFDGPRKDRRVIVTLSEGM
jgi:secondary thiamine-phosphate synthase enzyme